MRFFEQNESRPTKAVGKNSFKLEFKWRMHYSKDCQLGTFVTVPQANQKPH